MSKPLSFSCKVKYFDKIDTIDFRDVEVGYDIFTRIIHSKSTVLSLPFKNFNIYINDVHIDFDFPIKEIPNINIVSQDDDFFLNRRLYMDREERVKKLLELLVRQRIIFLRAPPFTGKTIVGKLICKYLKKNYKDSICEYISFTGIKEKEELEDVFKNRTGRTYEQWENNDKDKMRIIVMDETQLLFNDERAQNFFNKLSTFKRDSSKNNLYIFMMSNYGYTNENTPISIPFTIDNESILDNSNINFTHSEFDSFVKMTNPKEFNSFPHAVNYLWEITNGHIGLIKTSLYQLEITKNAFNCDWDIIQFLFSKSFISSIMNTSSMVDIIDDYGIMKIVKKVIKAGLSRPPKLININNLDSQIKKHAH